MQELLCKIKIRFKKVKTYVAGRSNYLILIEDDKGTFLHDTFPVPHFTLASPESFGFVDLVNILESLAFLQENVGFLGLGVGLNFVGDNQR